MGEKLHLSTNTDSNVGVINIKPMASAGVLYIHNGPKGYCWLHQYLIKRQLVVSWYTTRLHSMYLASLG